MPAPKIPFMAKLSGVAAETRLAEAWEEIFGQDPTNQQIIHVLTRPSGYPAWLTGFTPFEAWMHNGCDANDEIWRNFAEIAAPWPYIHNARHAVAVGISNVRIFVLERANGNPHHCGCGISLKCISLQLRHCLARRSTASGMKTVTIPVSRTAATTSIFGELPALCSLVTKTATCPGAYSWPTTVIQTGRSRSATSLCPCVT